MRTAVVRVDVDPTGLLQPEQLREGMAALIETAKEAGAGVVEADLTIAPTNRRQVEVLIEGDDADAVTHAAVSLCANAFGPFGVQPAAGVLTYTSRGTDDDAHGVLAGLGLHGDVDRVAGDQGWDTVHVTLDAADLRRVPESRVHTALEASLNCEVHIHTR
jgi:hypothetical protein